MNAIRTSIIAAVLLTASALFAIQPPQGDAVAAKAYGVPELYIANAHQPLARLPLTRALALESQLTTLGVPSTAGFYDLRSGRWGTLLLSKPLIPGGGVGNALTWSLLGRTAPAGDEALKQAAWKAFTAWLTASTLR